MATRVAGNGIKSIQLFDVTELGLNVNACFVLYNTSKRFYGCLPFRAIATRQRPFAFKRVVLALNEGDIKYAVNKLEDHGVYGKGWGNVRCCVLHTISIPHLQNLRDDLQ